MSYEDKLTPVADGFVVNDVVAAIVVNAMLCCIAFGVYVVVGAVILPVGVGVAFSDVIVLVVVKVFRKTLRMLMHRASFRP